jgi:hypothetical protein
MIIATPLFAATTKGAPAKAVSPRVGERRTDKSGPTNSPPDFAAMLGFIDKLFPPQPAPDPARLAMAQLSVQAMWPNGAYGKMTAGLVGGMFDRVMQLKTSDLAPLGSKAEKVTGTSRGDISLHDQVANKDPYFDRRMAAMRDALDDELAKISAIVDPRIREGLARAMARRFDGVQLGEINRFFSTPTGQLFAGQYMQLWVEPDTMRSLFSSMPELMKLMPEISEKLKAANDKFPKPPAAALGPKKQ